MNSNGTLPNNKERLLRFSDPSAPKMKMTVNDYIVYLLNVSNISSSLSRLSFGEKNVAKTIQTVTWLFSQLWHTVTPAVRQSAEDNLVSDSLIRAAFTLFPAKL